MAQIVIMPTSALCRLSVKGVVGRGNCRLGSAQSEAVEKGEQGVGWLVATGLGRERLDAVDRLLLVAHVGVQVHVGRRDLFVAEPQAMTMMLLPPAGVGNCCPITVGASSRDRRSSFAC
jgi:hypothetical protein